MAVDPPLAVGDELAAWARAVAATARACGEGRTGLRLIDPASLHVTLCFLGSRPVGEIDALAGALAGCGGYSCELSVGAPVWLPARRPRTLAVEIHDEGGELARLQQHLRDTLAGVSDWSPESRRFLPHLTVARLRDAHGREPRPSRHDGERGRPRQARPRTRSICEQPLPVTPRLRFTPRAVVLYRSWLEPDAASYEPLACCELAPAGA